MAAATPAAIPATVSHFAFQGPRSGASWAATTPAGLKPLGTGGIGGAPGGTRITIGEETAVESSGPPAHAAASAATVTPIASVSVSSRFRSVSTMRYSKRPRERTGFGRTADQRSPSASMRTEYHPAVGVSRNWSSALAT